MTARRQEAMIDRILSLKSAGGFQISPDGSRVAYTVDETDWEKDRFVSQIWIAEVNTGRRFQLTQGEKGAFGPRWSPDGTRLAFLSGRPGSDSGTKKKAADTQVWLISPTGGEGARLTHSETDISGFRWSPDGKQIAFHAPAPETKAMKTRKEKYGDFEVVDEDVTMSELWTVNVKSKRTRRLFSKPDRSVMGYEWSPDGTRLALTLAQDPRPRGGHTRDLYLLNPEGGRVRKLVRMPGPHSNPVWSPDGKQIAFNTAMGQEYFYYANTRVAVVAAGGGKPICLSEGFDESAYAIAWGPEGIYFSASQKTASHLFRLDPESRAVIRISGPDGWIGSGFDFSADFKSMAFSSADAAHLPELFVSQVAQFKPRRLTRMHDQVRRWKKGSREVVRWKSQDGTEIEGILYKPAGFNPRRKYPLLVVIHGGPAGTSRPLLDLRSGVYPIEVWLEKGAVILNPNYRGSSGYGERFRSLNVRRLGVGDMWDVMSGVDYLIRQGFVDPGRMGAMGWSQGGYISAFLTTHTDRFRAISVGAGISNWTTYYVNTDIPPFTRQYLRATPWEDPEIYAETSPMAAVRNARTPTLIQHGENDRRVPIPNAYELRQGLEDQGVPVRMVVYKGFGHGIDRPKSIRAAMVHNLEWFDRWVFKKKK